MAFEDIQKQALNSVASNMPVRNQAVANQLAAGSALGMQQAAKALTTPTEAGTVNVMRQAQAAAPQLVAQQGEKQAQAAGQAAQNAVDVGKQALINQQQQQANSLAVKKLQIDGTQSKNTARLAALNEDVKNKLVDMQLQFKKDEAGRSLFNERQLADWAVSKAKSVEELKNYEQKANQMHARIMQIMQTAQAKIMQKLEQQNKLDIQQMDQKYRGQLVLAKASADREIARKQAQDAERASYSGALWGIGAVVGNITK